MASFKALLLLALIFTAVYTSGSDSDYEHDHDHDDHDHDHEHNHDLENEVHDDHENDFYKGHIGCKHDHLNHDPQFLDIEEELTTTTDEEGRLLASSNSQFRIYPYYSILANSAPSAYLSYIQYQLAPPVIAYFQAALQVKYRVSGALKVPSVQRQLCGINTPNILINGGVAADFFIFFDSTHDAGGSWVADSYVCFMATDSSRPLIATTKFNRGLLLNSNGNVLIHEKNTYLLMHEMTHLLGFSTSLYPYFLDNNGRRRTGHIKSGYVDGTTSTVLSTPILTQKLRNFFGCSSLSGAYMENSGSSATAGSHFERRQFVFEFMSSGLVYQQRVSEFTLALLEDSGWYIPNYNYAEPYHFGAGQGCGFLTSSCASSSFNYGEFCKTSSATRACSFQGRGGGTCQSDFRSDGCKYYNTNLNDDCENPSAANFARLPNLQSFGRTAGSKCFNGNLASTSSGTTATSFCFKYTCQGSGYNTVVSVQVGSKVVTCKKSGFVEIPGYYGSITCPDPLYFCQTTGKAYCPRNCMGRGNCSNGKCVCYKGFTGIDCGLNI